MVCICNAPVLGSKFHATVSAYSRLNDRTHKSEDAYVQLHFPCALHLMIWVKHSSIFVQTGVSVSCVTPGLP
jgi:hypothetical protein